MKERYALIEVKHLRYGAFRVREHDNLADLRPSIKALGVLDPLTVALIGKTRNFEILRGNRRFTCAKQLHIKKVKARIIEGTPEERYQEALLDFLTKQHSPLEEARAYQVWMNKRLSVESLTKMIHLERTVVQRRLQLLDMPEHVKAMIRNGELSVSHAELLLSWSKVDQKKYALKIKDMNVRNAERYLRGERDQTEVIKQEKQGHAPISKRIPEESLDEMGPKLTEEEQASAKAMTPLIAMNMQEGKEDDGTKALVMNGLKLINVSGQLTPILKYVQLTEEGGVMTECGFCGSKVKLQRDALVGFGFSVVEEDMPAFQAAIKRYICEGCELKNEAPIKTT